MVGMAEALDLRRRRRLAGAATLLAALGLAVAAYLSWIELRGGPSEAGALLCGPGSGCAAAWESPYARLAGVPVAVLGAGAYLALLILGLWSTRAVARSGPAPRQRRRDRRPEPRTRAPWTMVAASAVAWAGAVFSLYLVGVQVGVLRTLCPWCTASAVIMVALAVLYTLALAGPLPRLPLAAGVAGGLALALLNYVPASGTATPAGLPPQEGAAAGEGAVVATLADLESLLTIGDPSAPAHVEIYSDFQCPYCAMAAEQVIAPLRQEDVAQGRIRLTFHNFAFLGQESQWAAEAAACAAVQGRFWEYHDRLFASALGENVGSFTFSRLERLARETGLDAAAFQRCLEDRRMRRLIDESRQEGRDRGVRATPTFFVNGRKVEGLVPLSEIRRLAYGP
ncbi:MAG TPA: vitamin K epoxide reductase family protein [Limnochordales bacterium]